MKNIHQYITIIMLLVITAAFSLITPQFFSFQNFTNILIQGSSLAIVATGMTFVIITRGIDLSVGSTMFLAGVISGKMVVADTNLWLACLLILLIGILFGYINASLIYRFKVVPFIVTLATFYMGRGLGLFISETRAVNLPDVFLSIGTSRILGIPFPIAILFFVVLIAHLVLTQTAYGTRVYAVGNSVEKARKAGLPIRQVVLSAYIICGFLAALGGFVAIAQLGAISPSFGMNSELMAISAVVLGGTSLYGGQGNVFPGTLVGALTIQTLQNGLVMINANPYVYPIVTGLVIFTIVLMDSLKHRKNTRSLQTFP